MQAVDSARALLDERQRPARHRCPRRDGGPFRTEDGRPVAGRVARLHETPFNETDRALLEAVTVAGGQALERIWAYEARNRSAKEQAALRPGGEVDGALARARGRHADGVRGGGRALDCDTVARSLGDEVEGYVVVGAGRAAR